MNHSKLFQALCGAILLAGASQATFACSATPENGMIEINELPAYISEPGNYCLKAVEGGQYNINNGDYATAIYVETDFATIDLNDQTIINVASDSTATYGVFYNSSFEEGMVEVSNGNFDGFSTGIGLYNSFPNNTSNASLENVNAFNSATGIKAQGWRSITLSDTDISAIKGISLTGMEYANIKGAKIQLINNSNFTSAAGIELSNIDQSLLERVDILGDSTLDSYGISADAEEDSVMNIKNIRGSNLVNGVRYGSNTTGTYNETVFTNISNKCYIGGIKGKLNVCRRTQ